MGRPAKIQENVAKNTSEAVKASEVDLQKEVSENVEQKFENNMNESVNNIEVVEAIQKQQDPQENALSNTIALQPNLGVEQPNADESLIVASNDQNNVVYTVKKAFKDGPQYRIAGVEPNVYEIGTDVSHFDASRLKSLVNSGRVSKSE